MPPLFGPPISDEHFAALGRVANAWAGMEHLIDVISAHLVGSDYEACLCLTAQVIGPARKLDALLSLMKLRKVPSPLIKKAGTLAGSIKRLGDKRNRALHDPWESRGVPDEGYYEFTLGGLLQGIQLPNAYAPHRHEVTAREKLVMEHKRVDTGELKKLEEDIEARKLELLGIALEAAIADWMAKNEFRAAQPQPPAGDDGTA